MSPPAATLLVVDDEPDLRTLYELTLVREGYRVETAASVQEACAQLDASLFDGVITDMRLPDGLGLEILELLQRQQRAERCIVITAYGSADNAVQALRCGAFDYLTKPVDLKLFRRTVAAAMRGVGRPAPLLADLPAAAQPSGTSADAATTLPAQRTAAPHPLTAPARQALERLVGESGAMRQLKHSIQKVAKSMAPVLIQGESGTGKELVARALHACSHRADAPWVAVNCGAIPEHLLEAEFFGARKGAYTGATADRLGFFQTASGGTLFLDEIGELPLSMQSKLLRAIQERRVRPLGAPQEEAVDVRIFSATHRCLASDVQAGRFRQDLYYRLNVIELALPALRERREDLPLLCRALIARIAADSGLPTPELSPALLAHVAQHPLSGNVRELENLLHRAMALGDDVQLLQLPGHETGAPSAAPTTTQVPPPLPMAQPLSAWNNAPAPSAHPAHEDAAACEAALPHDLTAWLDAQERVMLQRALYLCGYNRSAAAARVGISLRQMRYRMDRLNIPWLPDEAPTSPHGI